MAEYYPLLDRAVSGLTEQTAEARQSIYDRARAALIGQLRRMEPPIPEVDIARESTALDEAIARVEAKYDSQPAAAAARGVPARREIKREPPAPGARPAETYREGGRDEPPPPAIPTRVPATPAPRNAPPALPTGTAPPVAPPPSRERPMPGQRPVLGQRPTLGTRPAPPIEAPLRSGTGGGPTGVAVAPPQSVRAAAPSRGSRPVMALRPVLAAPTSQTRERNGLPTAGTLPTADSAIGTDDAPAETVRAAMPGGFSDLLDEAARRDDRPPGDEALRRDEGDPSGVRSRDAALRPPAPRPPEARRFGWRGIGLTGLAVLVMIGVGVAAYRMRDKPEQVVATRSDTTSAEASAPGKSIGRASPAADADPQSGAAVPAPVGQNATDTGANGYDIAVAQRAALLVDAPEEPQKVRTYVGTVVWHLDSVSPGQGQPLATAVKADIDIPDAKLKVTMLMQSNPEPQLPASHTIEFHFLPQPGNVLGAIKQINVPEMRKDDDAQIGDPLTGVPVAITDNYFLVGLSRGAAEKQNVKLIGERNWFDVGFQFTSGKLGKLTFEKGPAGQHTFDDALKAWN